MRKFDSDKEDFAERPVRLVKIDRYLTSPSAVVPWRVLDGAERPHLNIAG
jgi:hypothetical protein